MSLVDLDRLDSYLDGDTELLAEQAIAFLEGETHRYFGEPTEFVEVREGTGTMHLWLKEPPDTNEATTVEVRTLGDEWETIDSDTYEVQGRKLVRLGGRVWDRLLDNRWRPVRHQREYRVTYTSGYDALPEDIEAAAFEVIRWMKAELDRDDPMIQSEDLGDYSYTLIGPMRADNERPFSARTMATINRWRDEA